MSTKATNFKNNKKRYVKKTVISDKPTVPMNKAEKFIIKAVQDNDVFKGLELFVKVSEAVGAHLGNNKRLPPEYDKALKKLASMLNI